ncbi:hypothetical protein Hanom_Chr10g00949191 [Helianthus anomalus]
MLIDIASIGIGNRRVEVGTRCFLMQQRRTKTKSRILQIKDQKVILELICPDHNRVFSCRPTVNKRQACHVFCYLFYGVSHVYSPLLPILETEINIWKL